MAVTVNKSAAITNRDATPITISNAAIAGGVLKEAVGVAEALTTDSVGSTYIFASIPSNARVSDLLLSCDAATAGAMDFGVYQTTANGSAVVDADFFSSAVSLASALNHSNITYEATATNISVGEQPLWQQLGLSADPKIMYDVVATTTTAMTAQATVMLKVRYV